MSDYDAVLVYDGECPYCSVAARVLERLDAVGAVSWYDEPAQSFLAAQFGEPPFAMVLADARRNRVYAGRSAAEELARRAGAPEVVGSLVRGEYGRVAAAVGWASGRDREPDDVHDVYPMADAARERFDALRRAAGVEADLVSAE